MNPRLVPRRPDGVDLFSRPLTPNDVYVLGWVDGATSVGDIIDCGALSAEETIDCLRRLVKLGLLVIPGFELIATGPPTRPVPIPEGLVATPSQQPTAPPPAAAFVPEGAQRTPTVPVPGLDARALKESVQLDHEDRLYVLTFFGKLGSIDHYAVLGVEHDASDAAINEAWVRRNGWIEDRLERDQLGSFREKLLEMNSAVDAAHDILSDPTARAAYDRELDGQS